MLFADLLDIMLQRMERLGFVDQATGQADAAEAELYLFQALLDIIETADIPAYTHFEPSLALTIAGQPDYTLPEDFGRLLLPRVQNKRGMAIFDGTFSNDLEYIEPNAFTRQVSFKNAAPTQFTVMERTLWLYPSPDGNGSSNYMVRGTYIVRASRPELDDEVLVSYPAALVDVALLRLGSDIGKDTQPLERMREESMARLVRGSR